MLIVSSQYLLSTVVVHFLVQISSFQADESYARNVDNLSAYGSTIDCLLLTFKVHNRYGSLIEIGLKIIVEFIVLLAEENIPAIK